MVAVGVIAPLVMHSTQALAIASILMMGVGLSAWVFLRKRWPQTGIRAVA